LFSPALSHVLRHVARFMAVCVNRRYGFRLCVNSLGPARQFNAAKVVFPTPMTQAAFAHQVEVVKTTLLTAAVAVEPVWAMQRYSAEVSAISVQLAPG
jgi:hypothetical protein